MEQDPNPFNNITILQYFGPYHTPKEITLQNMYDRGWWISFVCYNNIVLVKKTYNKKNNVSFFCKFTKIYRGTIDNKAMKKIERFNNKQWKKYKNKMLGDDYYEANNQI